jgi:hypothetical protein
MLLRSYGCRLRARTSSRLLDFSVLRLRPAALPSCRDSQSDQRSSSHDSISPLEHGAPLLDQIHEITHRVRLPSTPLISAQFGTSDRSSRVTDCLMSFRSSASSMPFFDELEHLLPDAAQAGLVPGRTTYRWQEPLYKGSVGSSTCRPSRLPSTLSSRSSVGFPREQSRSSTERTSRLECTSESAIGPQFATAPHGRLLRGHAPLWSSSYSAPVV